MFTKEILVSVTAIMLCNAVMATGVTDSSSAARDCCAVHATVYDDENEDVDTVLALPQTDVDGMATRKASVAALPHQTVTTGEMHDLGIVNIGQALARMAGTQVRDYGGVGGMKTVSVHSLGAAHTGVSYDGVPVSNCQAGQVDVGRFFVDNLSSVSLDIGHEDDMLQSASGFASGAMLRLNTFQPVFADATSRHAMRAVVKAGSWGEFSPALMYACRNASGDVCGINAVYQRADGHYPFTLSNGDNPLRYERSNTDVESGNIELNWQGRVWSGGHLKAKAYAYASERGLPGTAIYYNNVSHQRLWDTNAFGHAVLTQTLGPRLVMKVRAKYNYAYNCYEDTDSKYTGGMKRDRYMQHEGYLSATAWWKVTEPLDVSMAQDVCLNTLDMSMGTTSYEPNPMRFTSITSLQARYTHPRVSVSGGLLLATASETVEKGASMPAPARLSPMLSFTLRPWLSQGIYLRAMYKDTYRMPSFNDLYYDRIGNTQLLPEKACEWSMGVVWSRTCGNVELSMSADAYVHRVTDKIVAMPGVYVWKMQNYGRVHISGVDATLRGCWTLGDCALTVDGAYTYQRAIDRTDASRVEYGNQLPYTPRHSGNVSAVVTTPWVGVSWNMQAVGQRYAMAATIPENLMPCYTVHDMNVWREFTVGSSALRVQLSLCNLANRQYDIIRYYPMPGRHVRATATFTL